jgi:hypothetical protein
MVQDRLEDHHRAEHLLARLDADAEERVLDVFERRQQRQRKLDLCRVSNM